ncbi:hypothetical protein L596_001115 [Steinernema carpocapsae]|uniref:Uncharacterized protein n=1 Tax=Steinernema carpocapsae TaxID=34508 RepID=A0A4V6I7A4_STECR|nr:hypothetical protein L596_001115 [Steinernema carpocapsae]
MSPRASEKATTEHPPIDHPTAASAEDLPQRVGLTQRRQNMCSTTTTAVTTCPSILKHSAKCSSRVMRSKSCFDTHNYKNLYLSSFLSLMKIVTRPSLGPRPLSFPTHTALAASRVDPP